MAEETAAWSVIIEFNRPHDATRAPGYRLAAGPPHIRGNPTRADCVHEDAVLSDLSGNHTGHRIQRCLGHAVGRRPSTHRLK
jgi:hypothetical protein